MFALACRRRADGKPFRIVNKQTALPLLSHGAHQILTLPARHLLRRFKFTATMHAAMVGGISSLRVPAKIQSVEKTPNLT